MKYCHACGYKITEDNLRYCPECGSELDGNDNVYAYSSNKIYDTQNSNLLIGYNEQGVDMPCYEIALYVCKKNELILEEHINDDNGSEKYFQKLVPMEVYKKALEIVNNFSLKSLLNRKGSGLSGKTYMIKFKETLNSDDLYQFSSENVGEKDTIMMFVEMKNLLSSYKN